MTISSSWKPGHRSKEKKKRLTESVSPAVVGDYYTNKHGTPLSISVLRVVGTCNKANKPADVGAACRGCCHSFSRLMTDYPNRARKLSGA